MAPWLQIGNCESKEADEDPGDPGDPDVPPPETIMPRFGHEVEEVQAIRDRIWEAKNAATVRRLRLLIPVVAVGSLLLAVGVPMVVLAQLGAGLPPVGFLIGVMLVVLGTVILPLPLLPTNRQLVKAGVVTLSATALVMGCVPLTITTVQLILGNTDRVSWSRLGERLCHFFVVIAVVLRLLLGLKRLRSPELLDLFWLSITRVFLGFGLLVCVWVPIEILVAKDWQMALGKGILGFWAILVGALVLKPFRTRVRAFLLRSSPEVAAAATVAAFMDHRAPEEIIATALQSFRYVTLDKLECSHFLSREPDPNLNAFAKSTSFGNIDAFVSHSWQDDAENKFNALQKWREDFKGKYQREPRLWIDKFCIDQKNIEENLACLPVCLAGCKSMLVLFGPTYSKRLWCVMELFVFLQMGTSQQKVEVRFLEGTCHNIVAQIQDVDVGKATCFNPEEAAYLRATIEAGIGSCRKFNHRIQRLLMRRISRFVSCDNLEDPGALQHLNSCWRSSGALASQEELDD